MKRCRKHVMWVSGMALFALMAWVPASPGGLPVEGVVFLDADGDGRQGAEDAGVAGVAVSDGIDVHFTDGEGRFRFTARPDIDRFPGQRPIIRISLPDGHRATGPWFVHLTGESAHDRSLSFGLESEAQPRPFEFVHVTDMHWPRARATGAYEAFREEVRAHADRWRLIVDTGDLADSADFQRPDVARYQMEGSRTVFEGLPMPVFVVSGNHDVIGNTGTRWAAVADDWTPDHPDFGWGLFRQVWGPRRWSFTYSGIHFVGIETMVRNAETETWTRGTPPAALAWMKQDLARLPENTPVLLFAHCPPPIPPLLEACPDARILAGFYGDGHQDLVRHIHGIPFYQSGSLSAVPQIGRARGYRVIRLDEEDRLQEIYRFVGQPRALVIQNMQLDEAATPARLNLAGYAYGYDPDGLEGTVRIGEQEQVIQWDAPTPLAVSFESTAAVEHLPAGYHVAAIEGREGEHRFAASRRFLRQSGPNPDRDPHAAPVQLGLVLGGVTQPLEVRINDVPVAQAPLSAHTGTFSQHRFDRSWWQPFTFAVPNEALKRLNTITFHPGLDEDGRPGQAYAAFVYLESGGRIHVCRQRPGYGIYFVYRPPFFVDLEDPLEDEQRYRALLDKMR